MSEWESIFGAGVSAESIIDGINASWDAERREEFSERECQRRALFTAYQGNPEIKVAALEELAKHRRAGRFVANRNSGSPGHGAFSCVVSDPGTGYAEFEDRYRIPEAMVRIADAIFADLMAQKPKDHEIHFAMEWPTRFMDSIQPGVDLRLVIPKFLAWVVSDVSAGDKACKPALALVEARARGVFVQDEVAIAAAKLAWGRLDNLEPVVECASTQELAAAAASKAAEGTAESAAYAAWFAARANAVIVSHGPYRDGWMPYMSVLIELIEAAPKEEAMIIDLNSLTLQIKDLSRQIGSL